MTVRQLTVPIAGSTPAALVLPQPLTHEALGRLEAGLMDTLVRLRRELGGTAADAGKVEYESWIQHLRQACR